jgi:hypothetical protein
MGERTRSTANLAIVLRIVCFQSITLGKLQRGASCGLFMLLPQSDLFRCPPKVFHAASDLIAFSARFVYQIVG